MITLKCTRHLPKEIAVYSLIKRYLFTNNFVQRNNNNNNNTSYKLIIYRTDSLSCRLFTELLFLQPGIRIIIIIISFIAVGEEGEIKTSVSRKTDTAENDV